MRIKPFKQATDEDKALQTIDGDKALQTIDGDKAHLSGSWQKSSFLGIKHINQEPINQSFWQNPPSNRKQKSPLIKP